jgi:hypothetical protein
MVKKNKKIIFWDRWLFITMWLFLFPMILYAGVPAVENYGNLMFVLGIMVLLSLVMIISFRLAMVRHAYKMKRYGWMIVNLILGEVFVLWFYFRIFKK